VKACRRAKLSPSVGGQIAALNVREGDKVKAGDVLLELWNKDLKAKLDLARSEADAAQSRVKAACLNAEVARREADRLTSLRGKGVASVEQTDRAETEARAKQAECEAAKASASVSSAQIRAANAEIERTRLLAPFAGVVAEINGELNEFVTPSPIGIPTPPAIDLVDNTCFYVTAPIDEVDAPRISPRLPARVTLDAFPSQSFSGEVRRVADYVLDIEKQARTVDVEVELADPEALKVLLAGYSADAEIILDKRDGVLRIPSEALLEDRIYVLDRITQKLVLRHIETGIKNWDWAEVRAGLEPGELVVTSIDRAGVEDGALARAQDESGA